jgi:beta-galactosidase
MNPKFDDTGWRILDLPHDWSREDLPSLASETVPVLSAAPGKWRFMKGDNKVWQEPAFDDSGWQEVTLPAPWEEHSGYTEDNVYGWFRRRIEIPTGLKGKDITIDLGKIDDVDETFLNGVKIGGHGSVTPKYRTAYATPRRYWVSASALKGDGTDLLAVRVYDGEGAGGIVSAGGPHLRIGPFDSVLSEGGGSTGHVVGGTGWYRKAFKLPAGAAWKRARIEFDGVYMNADVWLNGAHLGEHPYGYTAFSFDLTDHLKPAGEENILAVRVRNIGANSRWYSGSGIYRQVRLVLAGQVHVGLWGVFVTTPKADLSRAKVHVAVTVDNRSTASAKTAVKVRLVGPGGKKAGSAVAKGTLAAGKSSEFRVKISVPRPKLWSPDTPALYSAEVEVTADGRPADRVTVPFGIRSIKVDPERGFFLNGKPVKFKGGCVHHDNGPLGSMAIARAEERRIEILKESGYNAVRTAHNPPSAAFLDACDRVGMLVMDESYDCWRKGKNPEDFGKHFDKWWKTDVDSMVRRDRNHPSVVMWSIGNEIPERYTEDGAHSARMQADRIRELDPTRPVTSAFNGVNDDADPYLASLEISGYNYNFDKYVVDHHRLPGRLMLATESVGLTTFDYWAPVSEFHWVLGDFIWTAIDYLGESGIGASPLDTDPAGFLRPWPYFVSNCSDLDYCCFTKPQGLYRRVMWGVDRLNMVVHRPIPEGRTEKVTFWGWPNVTESWTWDGQEGKEMEVHVYANCETVRLLLNGKQVGEQPAGRAHRYWVKFKVPYAPGELKAVALDGTRKVAECVLATAGKPAQIRMTADRSEIRADREDLVYVTVTVLDAKGVVVPEARDAIRFTVSGPGELVATGSGSPDAMASFTKPERVPFEGKCLAILRPAGGAGTIVLRAEGPGLAPAEVKVRTR